MFETREVAAAVEAVRSALERLANLPHTALDAARTSTLLTAVADLEHVQTVAALAQARVLDALDVVAPVTWAPAAYGPPPPAPGVEQTTAHEIAATLGTSVSMVRDRLATARVLRDVPAVVAAAASGALRWWQVRRVAEAVVELAPAARALVDGRVAADALAGRCRNRFGARVARAVLAADPGRADRAHEDGVADRRVTVRPSPAGMAWFGACLPAQDALTVARCLDELAAEPDGAALDAVRARSTGPYADPGGAAARTADQRRADALTGMARAALEALHDCAGVPDGVTDEGLRERFTHHLAEQVGARPGARTPGHHRNTPTPPAPTSPAPTSPAPNSPAPNSPAPTSTDAARPDSASPPVPTAAPGSPHTSSGREPSAPEPGPTMRKGPRRAARRRAEIQLVVSAETVLGIADDPGELAGYGPIGPEQARRIAHLAGATWQRLITDPVTGVVLDHGRTAYTPPATLADHVRARFGWTCTRPGCSNATADLDHATAWAESGATSVDNLHTVCRGCHTAKHRGWTVRIAPDGTTTWRTPHGRSCSTRPTDLRPEDHLPDRPGGPRRTGATDAGDSVRHPVDATGEASAAPATGWWTEVSRDVAAAAPVAVPVVRSVPAPF